MSYQVTHLHSKESFTRPRILVNQNQQSREWHQEIDPAIETFHQQLPSYGETKLHELPSVAAELGFSNVFVKDESSRFGLPSFKILGASWAIHRGLCQHLGLPASTTLAELTDALKGRDDVSLVLTTEGNWGRAVARMGKYLGIPVLVYVPYFMNAYTQDLICSEGAEVKLMEGKSYDDCVDIVKEAAGKAGQVAVMDLSWEGFTEIPQWVTDGYNTMLREVDRQVAAATDGKTVDLAIAAVGAGSWAAAVVEHYKGATTDTKIVSAEPPVAACLKESLHCGENTSITTGETIMNGMNCGSLSSIAWSTLRDGIFASVAVTDVESHRDVQYMQSQGINAGPCGAGTLAALRALCEEAIIKESERKDMITVLFSTEGGREYEIPN